MQRYQRYLIISFSSARLVRTSFAPVRPSRRWRLSVRSSLSSFLLLLLLRRSRYESCSLVVPIIFFSYCQFFRLASRRTRPLYRVYDRRISFRRRRICASPSETSFTHFPPFTVRACSVVRFVRLRRSWTTIDRHSVDEQCCGRWSSVNKFGFFFCVTNA